jgi:hypothetical protein
MVAVVVEGQAQQQNDRALIQLANGVALDRIPALLVLLAARLVAETNTKTLEKNDLSCPIEPLVTAGDLASHLGLRESWVRNEERVGRLPSVHLGRYIRFRITEVERALARTHRQGPE